MAASALRGPSDRKYREALLSDALLCHYPMAFAAAQHVRARLAREPRSPHSESKPDRDRRVQYRRRQTLIKVRPDRSPTASHQRDPVGAVGDSAWAALTRHKQMSLVARGS